MLKIETRCKVQVIEVLSNHFKSKPTENGTWRSAQVWILVFKTLRNICSLSKHEQKTTQWLVSYLRMFCIKGWNSHNKFKQNNANRPPIRSCTWKTLHLYIISRSLACDKRNRTIWNSVVKRTKHIWIWKNRFVKPDSITNPSRIPITLY